MKVIDSTSSDISKSSNLAYPISNVKTTGHIRKIFYYDFWGGLEDEKVIIIHNLSMFHFRKGDATASFFSFHYLPEPGGPIRILIYPVLLILLNEN
jgi:hypothetical protein